MTHNRIMRRQICEILARTNAPRNAADIAWHLPAYSVSDVRRELQNMFADGALLIDDGGFMLRYCPHCGGEPSTIRWTPDGPRCAACYLPPTGPDVGVTVATIAKVLIAVGVALLAFLIARNTGV